MNGPEYIFLSLLPNLQPIFRLVTPQSRPFIIFNRFYYGDNSKQRLFWINYHFLKVWSAVTRLELPPKVVKKTRKQTHNRVGKASEDHKQHNNNKGKRNKKLKVISQWGNDRVRGTGDTQREPTEKLPSPQVGRKCTIIALNHDMGTDKGAAAQG